MEFAGKPLDAQKKYKVAGWAPVSEEAKAAGGEAIWDVAARYLRTQKTIPPRTLELPTIRGMEGNSGMAGT
jgi:sulfur-oxidizing protein SoxB